MSALLHLNTADFIIIGFILLSVLISLSRGFVREALSLATWVIAAYVAFTYAHDSADLLKGMIENPHTRTIVAFAALFLFVVIVGGLFNYFVGRVISISGLGFFDRILGIVFGAARGILVVALVIIMIKGTSLVERGWWRHSQLIPLFSPLTLSLESLFPKHSDEKLIMLHEQKK